MEKQDLTLHRIRRTQYILATFESFCCYVVMALLCGATVVWDIFSSDTNTQPVSVSTSILIVRVYFFARLIYAMWKRSASRLRTPIALFMTADLFVNALSLRSFGSATNVAIDVLWLLGIYVMYTGPSPREIIREFQIKSCRVQDCRVCVPTP